MLAAIRFFLVEHRALLVAYALFLPWNEQVKDAILLVALLVIVEQVSEEHGAAAIVRLVMDTPDAIFGLVALAFCAV
jgi:hypothetical protein